MRKHFSGKLEILIPPILKAEKICLILWGEKDNLIPIEYYYRFKQALPNTKYEIIADAGHAPFVEKLALLYEKLRTFLIEDDTITHESYTS